MAHFKQGEIIAKAQLPTQLEAIAILSKAFANAIKILLLITCLLAELIDFLGLGILFAKSALLG